MKKLSSLLVACLLAGYVSYAQTDIPNTANGGPIGAGSWLRFTSGGDVTSIQEKYGLNLNGSGIQPVKVSNTSLLIGYTSSGVNYGTGNALISGKVGIGTTNPQAALNVRGSVAGLIRLTPTSDNGEASIQFSTRASETDNSAKWALGPGVYGTAGNFAIGSTLYGNAVATFLTNGNVGIGTTSPKTNLDVNGTMLSSGSSANIDGVSLSFLANSGKVLTGWNRTKGGGETDFISNQANGETGGFAFYNYNNNSQEKQLMWIKGDGNVSIGTLDPKGYKLAVAGSIRATEIKVEALPWPDYVFKPTYKLPSLTEVKEYIDKNKHLPDMPSEQEVAKEGISLGEMNRLLVKKVEELTLYLIDLKKELDDLKKSKASPQTAKSNNE